MKREREPTQEELEKLLAWLASAGREYATTHYRLTRVFIVRGCIDAETLADEVMNRVAVRIDKLIKDYPGDPIKCLMGFADNVYLEYLRELSNQRKHSEGEPPTPPDGQAEREREERERKEGELREECLARCMEELSAADNQLFRRYFQEEERAMVARRKLAAELRLTANALRIKAYRIRRRLRGCMEACLEEIS